MLSVRNIVNKCLVQNKESSLEEVYDHVKEAALSGELKPFKSFESDTLKATKFFYRHFSQKEVPSQTKTKSISKAEQKKEVFLDTFAMLYKKSFRSHSDFDSTFRDDIKNAALIQAGFLTNDSLYTDQEEFIRTKRLGRIKQVISYIKKTETVKPSANRENFLSAVESKDSRLFGFSDIPEIYMAEIKGFIHYFILRKDGSFGVTVTNSTQLEPFRVSESNILDVINASSNSIAVYFLIENKIVSPFVINHRVVYTKETIERLRPAIEKALDHLYGEALGDI